MLNTPIDCSEKCEAKKRKTGKVTTQYSQEDEPEVEKATIVAKKPNTVESTFKKNPITFYVVLLSLFIIFVSVFIYFYF